MGILGMAIIVLLITVPISEAQSLMEDRVQDILARSGSLERLRQFPIHILAGLRQARNLVEQRYQTKLMERMMASYDESHVEHMLVHAMQLASTSRLSMR
ncbi:MAG: hypothetical protein D6690_04725 [Nitrospirae bacterium]|nr:MAG: hypothetical protein D6690_04725 [Nitrospirota bacterium]